MRFIFDLFSIGWDVFKEPTLIIPVIIGVLVGILTLVADALVKRGREKKKQQREEEKRKREEESYNQKDDELNRLIEMYEKHIHDEGNA